MAEDERQISLHAIEEAKAAVIETRNAMSSLRDLIASTSADNRVAMALIQGTVANLDEKVKEVRGQVENLVRGTGDRPGVSERLSKLELGLDEIAKGAKRRMETIGIFISASGALIALGAWIFSMVR